MDEEIYSDGFGNYFNQYGQPLSINDLIARGIDVVGAWSSRSPYVSPNDPRYRNRGGWFPNQANVPVSSTAPVAINQQGFQMPWWALLGIGLLAGSFLLGRRR